MGLDVKYFKTKDKGDCYVCENPCEIISISYDKLSRNSFHPLMLEGPYKEIIIEEKDFKKMIKLGSKRDRKGLIKILKRVHKKNERVLDLKENPQIKVKDVFEKKDELEIHSTWRSFYYTRSPVLE